MKIILNLKDTNGLDNGTNPLEKMYTSKTSNWIFNDVFADVFFSR